MFVHVVVRQLHLLERDNLLPQLFAGKGRVGVHVKSRGCRRIRFASLQPATAMIGVSIPLIVDRHDVHQHGVTTLGLEPAKGHSARREHPPAKRDVCEKQRGAVMIRSIATTDDEFDLKTSNELDKLLLISLLDLTREAKRKRESIPRNWSA